TAVVSVGHFGSPNRMYYGAIGDGVNLTARLETINKSYATSIIASDATWAIICDDFEGRMLESVAVKGKAEPVVIYELLGPKGEVDGKRLEAARTFEEAYGLYVTRHFDKAAEHFAAVLELMPNDLGAKTLLKRSREFMENPPPSSWYGVREMTTK
ncbi:MAG: adenylate/guanylate cyclase domain-containing protein, partial [Proteobacteria bacterium]|nr:adenylate/guanylate cyclase domain-containing protein [Pseudomonadota bacterium]